MTQVYFWGVSSATTAVAAKIMVAARLKKISFVMVCCKIWIAHSHVIYQRFLDEGQRVERDIGLRNEALMIPAP
jgi:hypothetical protein